MRYKFRPMTTANEETASADHELTKLLETAKVSRLSPDQEKQATILLKEKLLSGKAGLASAIEPLVTLPWIVGVNAVVEAWPELKPATRKQFLTELNAQDGDPGRRFRLSLARGLFSHDAAMAVKFAVAVCDAMTSGEGGNLSARDRQVFANVLIGKGKPWLLHLPLAELKAGEADAIIRCAVAVCFPGQCPPLTQQSVLSWIAGSGRLLKLPDESLQAIATAVKRWQPKLKSEFKKTEAELPPAIVEALQSEPVPQPPPKAKAPVQESRGNRPQPQKPSSAGFDLVAALRQIEAHVQSLRAELHQAKTDARRREPSPRRGQRETFSEPGQAGGPEVEELQRHNRQLEETVAELRHRLEDLAAHHEDVAVSMGAHEDKPVTDEKEQFKTLLGLKLQKDHAEFMTLAKEPPDEVFREHYRMLLEDVFGILEAQGVVFGQD